MVSFAVGALAPGRWWRAAIAGAMTQAGLVVGYYASARLSALPVAWSSVLIWVATGVVAGPVYAAAGAAWRDRRILPRVAALGLLGVSGWHCCIERLRRPSASTWGTTRRIIGTIGRFEIFLALPPMRSLHFTRLRPTSLGSMQQCR